MALTPTARRMLGTLPAYYDGEPLIERIIQSRANEVDRIDALIDQLARELIPGQATDALGLLGAWEQHLDLPVRPPDASEAQRSAKVRAALAALGAVSAADVLATIGEAMGDSSAFGVQRDTPTLLSDTLSIPYEQGSYNASVIEQIAIRMWPAHRRLLMSYADGFLHDLSLQDQDTL